MSKRGTKVLKLLYFQYLSFLPASRTGDMLMLLVAPNCQLMFSLDQLSCGQLGPDVAKKLHVNKRTLFDDILAIKVTRKSVCSKIFSDSNPGKELGSFLVKDFRR